jgi:hypothetical protein
MIGLLADHNIEQHGRLIWEQFGVADWRAMNIASFATLNQLGIDSRATDREIWLRCQRDEWLLLTANRNMHGDDSLEVVIRQLGGAESLPVLTLADADRVLVSAAYREVCAYRIAEIALDLTACRGITRLFIP